MTCGRPFSWSLLTLAALVACGGCSDADHGDPTSASPTVAESRVETVTIPLDRIWARDIPGTRDIRELEPEVFGDQWESLTSEELYRRTSNSLAYDISRRLGHLANRSTFKPKPGFAVLGTGLDALRAAHAVLTKKQRLPHSFPAGSEISAVFYSHPSQYSIRIEEIRKDIKPNFFKLNPETHVLKVFYRFIPLDASAGFKEHFALIPIGKFPKGRLEVRFVQQPMMEKLDFRGLGLIDSDYAEQVLCGPFAIRGTNRRHDQPTDPKPAASWPSEPERIPLRDVSSWQIPGTGAIGASSWWGTTEESAEEQQLLDDIRRALDVPTEEQAAGPGFAVDGGGSQALTRAYDVLVNLEAPTKLFLADREMTLVFLSHQSGRSCQLSKVERRGNRFEVHYLFVPHKTAEVTAHFALIPLGKLSSGTYEVDMIQDAMPEEFADWNIPDLPHAMAQRIVCRGFQFTVVAAPKKSASPIEPQLKPGPAPPPPTPQVLATDLVTTGYGGYTPKPLVSPDGKKVAFVSAGALYVCDMAGGPPKKLADFPNTLDAIFAQPNYADVGGDQQKQRQVLTSEYFRKSVLPRVRHFHTLRWTRSSEEILYAIWPEKDGPELPLHLEVQLVSTEGITTKLTEILIQPSHDRLRDCDLVFAGRFLLLKYFRKTVLYDLANERIAEPQFLNAVASSDGRNVLGFEADSKQLVMLNDRLEVSKRFDLHMPDKSFDTELQWSPDERFLLSRTQIGFDYYSNWVGFRMNLLTGERRELSGTFFREHFQFTGRGGEIVRCGQTGRKSSRWSGNLVTGAHLTIIPEGLEPDEDVWRLNVRDQEELPGIFNNYPPPLLVGPGGERFAIGIPRPHGERSGFIWHLLSRDGRMWQFPGEDIDRFMSPCDLVGFADDGRVLVARDETQIFTIPVPENW